MTPQTPSRMATAIAAIALFSGIAFAQTPPVAPPSTVATAPQPAKTKPAKARGARDKYASENSLGAANAQIDAAGGTPMKKRAKKVRKTSAPQPTTASTSPTGGDSGSPAPKP